MYPANHYLIRQSTATDVTPLRRLAERDSQPALAGPALIGESGGVPVAALSLGDGRLIADPFQRTVVLRQILRMHAESLRAYAITPSLRDRIRAALAPAPARHAVEA